MKKIFYIVLLLVASLGFAQNKGITYQAVIYVPGGQNAPGVNVSNVPMTNTLICLKFSFLDASSTIEYEEVVKTTTDEFGMVNISIGSGNQTGGYASSFATINWAAAADKSLKVALDATGLCTQFDELSLEKLASVPFANAALTAENVSGVVAIINGGTGAITASGARTNLGLGNVENTADLTKPMSTATKTYVDSQIASASIPDATTTTKGKIQLAGDLAGTAASPTVPGLALKANSSDVTTGLATKENTSNKSTDTTLASNSDVKFPTEKAVKTYVDSAITGATIVDADATTKGKLQLAGDLGGTAVAPTVPGLALKENAANKSTVVTLGTSNVLYPTQNAVKTYVDTAIAGATIVDADATTKGKLQLAGDLGGTAAAPTVPGLALKENAANKSTVVTLGTSDDLYPTQNAVKSYVDTAITGATIVDADATTKGKIQLAGDLVGTAASPTIAPNAITTAKVADNAITDVKITTVSGSKISGNITGNAANVSGIVGITNGGTGATTVSAARTNLGLGSAALNNTSDFEVPLSFSGPLVRTVNSIAIAPADAAVNGYLKATDFYIFSNKINSTEKAANNGVATLGNDGKIPSSQIPAISFQSVNVVNSQADMIANSAAQVGSITIRTDVNKNYVLSSLPASTLANWIELSTPNSVTSVNGYAGPNVSLTKADILLGNVDNTSDNSKPISTATQTALDLKANLASPTFTGTVSGITKTMVGLSNVDNTTDANKPISTATQTALDLKANLASPTFTGTVSGITKTMVGLSNVDNTSDANKPVSTATQAALNLKVNTTDITSYLALKEDTANKTTNVITDGTSDVKFPSAKAVKTYADSKIVDGITNAVTTSAPSQNAVFDALELKENSANKSTATDLGSTSPSDVLFPTQKAVKLYVDMQSANAGVADSSITSAKILDGTLVTADLADGSVTPVKFSGILPINKGGTNATTITAAKTNLGLDNVDNTTDANKPVSTATQTALDLKANLASPTFTGTVSGITKTMVGLSNVDNTTDANKPISTATQTALDLKENAANKSTTTTLGTSDVLFPTQKAVKTYVDTAIAGATIVDADATTKGKVQLAGDLTGTAASPEVAAGAISTAKLATDAVTSAKIKDGEIVNADVSATAAIAYSKLNLANAVVAGDITANAVTNAKLDKTNIPLSGFGAAAAAVALGANKLTGVADPTLAQDAATKNYVDTTTAAITTLADGTIYLGNVSNEATEVTLSGDVTMTNAGVTAIGTSKVVTTMLANAAVTTAKITDANVTTAKLAADAVTSAKITDGTIVVGDLADNAVETAKIKDANVTYAKIQNVSATDKVLGRVSTGAGVVEEIATTGSGNVVRATSPTLVTPTLGVATATSVGFSGSTSGTATLAAPAVAGTTTITLPSATGTLATLAGTETLTNKTLTTPILGVATATSVNKVTITAPTTSATLTIADGKTLTASNNATVSGTNTGDQTITLTGDVTGTGTGSFATTLANTAVTAGTYGSATEIPVLTVDAKGRITSASSLSTSSIAGANTVGAIAATSNAKGATISGTTITLTPADGTNGGVVTTGAQTFAGSKTFSSDILMGSARIGLGGGTGGAQGRNIAMGISALSSNTTGQWNVALGAYNLQTATTSSRNVAVGNEVMGVSAPGNDNTGVGNRALFYNTGSNNTGIGSTALSANTTGSGNTAIGQGAGSTNRTGGTNTFIGQGADADVENRENVTALGNGAIVTTNNTIQLGNSSVTLVNTSGAITSAAGIRGTQLTSTVATGTAPLVVTSTTPVANLNIGGNAATVTNGIYTTSKISDLAATTSAELAGKISDETGSGALVFATSPTLVTPTLGVATATSVNGLTPTAQTTGFTIAGGSTTSKTLTVSGDATVSGTNTGDQTITLTGDVTGTGTGSFATTIGAAKVTNAMLAGSIDLTTKVTGILPVANGGTGASTKNFVDLTTAQTVAGAKTFSNDMVVNGVKIGRGTGNDGQNTALGNSALGTGTGTRNTGVGFNALGNYVGTTFDNNTAVGYYNSKDITTGQNNTSIGAESLMAVTTASGNTSIGTHSLMSATGSGNTALGDATGQTITSGTNNTLVGREANAGIATATNATAIGYGATVAASNSIQLGNSSVTLVNTSGAITSAAGITGTQLTSTVATGTAPLVVTSTTPVANLSIGGNAATVTTNANLTGPITSVGNATSVASQTGTGTKFVMDTSPTLVTPVIGAATGTSLSLSSTLAVTGATTLSSTLGVTGNIAVNTDKFTIAASTGNTVIAGTIKVAGGSPGAGKVLISDANGLASWSNGSGSAVTTTTAAYGITLAEAFVFYTGTAAGTFSIPAAATTNAGKEITIKNKTGYTITITPASGTVYIDNANAAAASVSIGIEASNNWVKLVSDGTQWNVLRALF